MKLNVLYNCKSRAWVITFPCTEEEFTANQADPLRFHYSGLKATGIFDRTKGEASWFLLTLHPIWKAAVVHRMMPIQISIHAKLPEQLVDFLALPFDRRITLNFRTLIPVYEEKETIDLTTVLTEEPSTSMTDTKPDTICLEDLFEERKSLKRKLESMDTLRKRLKVVESLICKEVVDLCEESDTE